MTKILTARVERALRIFLLSMAREQHMRDPDRERAVPNLDELNLGDRTMLMRCMANSLAASDQVPLSTSEEPAPAAA